MVKKREITSNSTEKQTSPKSSTFKEPEPAKKPMKKPGSGRRKRTEEAEIRAKDKARIKNELLQTAWSAGEIRTLMRERMLRLIIEETHVYQKANNLPLSCEKFGPRSVTNIPTQTLKDHLDIFTLKEWTVALREISRIQQEAFKTLDAASNFKTKEDKISETLKEDQGPDNSLEHLSTAQSYEDLFKKLLQ